MDAETLSETRLTVSSAGAEAWSPTWSPEGMEIVFASDESGDHDIYVMNADGTDVRRLTDSGGNDVFPATAIK